MQRLVANGLMTEDDLELKRVRCVCGHVADVHSDRAVGGCAAAVRTSTYEDKRVSAGRTPACPCAGFVPTTNDEKVA